MNWIENLIWSEGVAHSIMLFAFIISTRIILEKIKIKGISLGITFILFVGIFAGHFGLKINHEAIHFMKELGLILFTYSGGGCKLNLDSFPLSKGRITTQPA